jgi:hypothetical protein
MATIREPPVSDSTHEVDSFRPKALTTMKPSAMQKYAMTSLPDMNFLIIGEIGSLKSGNGRAIYFLTLCRTELSKYVK